VILDAARVETIVVPEPDPPTESRSTTPTPAPASTPIHRRVAPAPARSDERPLVRSDAEVSFADAPPRDSLTSDTMISWTAESGFVEPPSGRSPMRSVGRYSIVDDAPASIAESGPNDRAEPATRYVPSPGPRHERPSRDLVDLVGRATGVDVGDTIIDRSPDVTGRAVAMGAVAFTDGSIVHLPAELGDVAQPGTRAVVAHELTHVAQQRLRPSAMPDESSAEGQLLEAEARAVQQAAGGSRVRPHFLRSHAPQPEAGVQRLPDDDDAYEWQNRDSDPSPSRQMLGMFSGYSWREAEDQREDDEDEAQARRFEFSHRGDLIHERNERYDDLLADALREKRLEALREDDTEEPELTRTEILAVRQQVDTEMPFQFGVPEGERAFHDTLPELEPGEEDSAATRRGRGSSAPGSGTPGTGPRRVVASVGPAATGRSTGSSSRRGGRPGSGDSGSGFDWQDREPTDQEAAQSLFGGGLLGMVIAESLGEETDEDRAAVEADRLPELTPKRQQKERQLRHRLLRNKLRERSTETARTDGEPEQSAIELTSDEIAQIRRQVDEEMPLEFAVPDYLESDEHVRITPDGTVGPAEPAADAEAESPAAAAEEALTSTTTDDDTDLAPTPAAAPESPESEPEPADDVDLEAADTGSAVAAGAAGVGAALGGALADRSDEPGDDERDVDAEVAADIFSAASDLDIDALSRKVWRRIRREMRTELLIDRERAGSLADMR
jgi:hypothetical protein